MKILGIIPARSGSKGVKNKNTITIKNRKLIEYTFKAALGSKLIDKIILTTNCKKVIKLSKTYRKIELLIRPEKLCKDNSSIFDVIKHTIQSEKKKFNFYDFIVLLQPTTPLKNSIIIDSGIRKIHKERGTSLVSVYEVDDNHPARMYKLKNKQLIPLSKNYQQENRQNLKKIFHRDGNLYIFKNSNFLKKNKNFYGDKIIPLILPRKFKLNIDNYLDVELAKLLIKKWN